MKRSIFTCGALALAAAAFAGGSKVWEHSSQADFEKARLDKLSLRSDGRLELAPVFREIHDPSTSYLWAVARDSRGHLFVGGSGQDNKALVIEIDASGKGKTLAELPGLEVHAIAVDARDRIYAATSPDGKIYRVRPGAAPETFYDPKAKYIWSLAFGKQGELYAATGEKGEIHRIAPDGKGSVFFKTDESHARSMTLDAQGNVYVGTDPGGLIFRVTPAGEGFVVYQTSKREVTALAVAPDGSVYAAAAGAKQPAVAPSAPAAPPPPPPAGSAAVRPQPALPPPGAAAPGPAGGSEVIRIEADGYPRRLWTNASDIAYALAFDAQGRALIGTGNKGAIYRLEDDLLHSLLLSAAPTQVTGLASGPGGAIYAVTGNIGKVYRIGPAIEKEGAIESETLDASYFTYWGRIHYGGTPAGGSVKLETRSGNLESTRGRWSPWAAVPLNSSHGRVASPAARFLQYRATLTAAADGKSPGLASVDIAYLPKNVAPVVELIETTPPNYRFPASSLTLSSAQSLNLPALSRNPGKPSVPGAALSEAPASSMSYAKGHIGARWLARDENGDSLLSTVEIRGERESSWKPLKADIRERNLSWDSTAYPDGEYRLRVTAADSPSNPPHLAMMGSLESYPFVIDNSPPRVTALAASRSGMKIEVRWHAADALNTLAKAEYSVDGGDWKAVEPTTRLSDSQEHDYVLALDGLAPGEHVIAVRITDEADNQAVEKIVASLQ